MLFVYVKSPIVRWLKLSLIALILFGASSKNTHAGVTLDQDSVLFEGMITSVVADDFIGLAYGKEIKRVIFRNSPGGSWSAGQRIGHWLLGKNITTVVDGYCASACASAFLGGDAREFSKDTPNSMLVFHAPYFGPDKAVVETLKYAYFSWIEKRTGRPVDDTFMKAINEIKDSAAGGVVFFSEDAPLVIAHGGVTKFCKGDEKNIPWGCDNNDQISAFSLGFVTTK